MPTKQIVLSLDEQDYEHVRNAIANRQHLMDIPPGDGNDDGRAIAEICRGWGEMMGMMSWTGDARKEQDDE